MVRVATVNDIPRLCMLAQVEQGRSRFKDVPFDGERAYQVFQGLITGLQSRVFISECGFIGGHVQMNLNNRFFTAYELAWYAEDGSGMELLRAFTDWARKLRAIHLVISNYAGIKEPAKFARVMKREGLEMLGSSYIKKL